jgi:ABC-type antimicrobial peptide transport system permease subunit
MLSRTYSAITNIVIRTRGDPVQALPTITSAIRQYDPITLVASATTMEALVGRSIAGERFRAAVSVVFGAVALFLAACGVYALGLRMVCDRRHEIGVRAALGATSRDLVGFMVKDALQPVGAALALGLPASMGAAHSLRAFLFGVSPFAPHVFLISALVLAAATLVAVFRPARQATRVDPAALLRY